MQIPVELKTIQYMLMIEQEGSFQKAAEALYISQPALSKYIKRLEETLSYPLYDRKNGRCTLTKPGKILLDRGRVLLADYSQMLKEMEAAALSGREVHFGWPTGYTVRYFGKLYSELSSSDTLLRPYIMEDSVERLISLLLQGNLDLVFIPAVYAHPDLEYITIYHEEFYVAVHKNHWANKTITKYAIDGQVDLQQLKELPFVVVHAKAFTEFLDPLFGREGKTTNKLFTCQDWDSAYHLAEQGIALTVLPFWYKDESSEDMAFYRLRSTQKTHRVFACAVKKDNPITPEMQAVINLAMEAYGDPHAGECVDSKFLTIAYRSSFRNT